MNDYYIFSYTDPRNGLELFVGNGRELYVYQAITTIASALPRRIFDELSGAYLVPRIKFIKTGLMAKAARVESSVMNANCNKEYVKHVCQSSGAACPIDYDDLSDRQKNGRPLAPIRRSPSPRIIKSGG